MLKRGTKSVIDLYSCDDYELLIGVYDSEAKRHRRCTTACRPQPGFVDASGEFEIAEHQIDQDHWNEGYKIVSAGNALRGFKREYLWLGKRTSVRSFRLNLPTSTSMARMRAPLSGAAVVRKKLNRTDP